MGVIHGCPEHTVADNVWASTRLNDPATLLGFLLHHPCRDHVVLLVHPEPSHRRRDYTSGPTLLGTTVLSSLVSGKARLNRLLSPLGDQLLVLVDQSCLGLVCRQEGMLKPVPNLGWKGVVLVTGLVPPDQLGEALTLVRSLRPVVVHLAKQVRDVTGQTPPGSPQHVVDVVSNLVGRHCQVTPYLALDANDLL